MTVLTFSSIKSFLDPLYRNLRPQDQQGWEAALLLVMCSEWSNPHFHSLMLDVLNPSYGRKSTLYVLDWNHIPPVGDIALS